MIAALCLLAAPALAQENFTVRVSEISDEKAVFATIESVNVIPARARLDGTIADLQIDEGDHVDSGQIIAVVVAGQLDPMIASVGAQISALEAELALARIESNRAEELAARDAAPQTRVDQARARVSVLESQLDALRQERGVIVQRAREGDVVAPASGRVLRVPVIEGAVVRPGETIAEIALDIRVLRLRLPERHARYINEGDIVRVSEAALTSGVAADGVIVQVYPEIVDGRVIADAQVEGLEDYFVGERVRVQVTTGERQAILIPQRYLSTRYGVDYVRIQTNGGEFVEVAVQTGRSRPLADMTDAVEILSGLSDGDVLVTP